MKILLLSAYDAASHVRWRKGLVNALPEHDWTVLSLPPRYFSWRIRGNSLCWAMSQRECLSQHYDLLIATSMVDLSALKGMVPSLASVPSIVYFHENQFEYPISDKQKHSLEPKMVNLYSAVCADWLVFNSEFNRETFIQGVKELMEQMPDQVPVKLSEQLDAKAQTIAVPLEDDCYAECRNDANITNGEPLTFVWNHRWEYDKGPDRLLNAVQQLPSELELKFHIVGQRFRYSPKEFDELRSLLRDRCWLGEWGYMESREAYRSLLRASDVALSTAVHEFQGLAVLEAVAAGCRPLVPARLSYLELFEPSYHYSSDMFDAKLESDALAENIIRLDELRSQDLHAGKGLAVPDVSGLSWTSLIPEYRQLCLNVAASQFKSAE